MSAISRVARARGTRRIARARERALPRARAKRRTNASSTREESHLAELRPSATGARADAMVADARALLEDAFTEKTGAFAETRARATRVVFAAIAEAESPEIIIAAMFARIEGVSVLGVR